MLCDDIILCPELPRLYDGLDKTFTKIKYAQKFVLSSEFATAADGLVDNLPELRKIIPYCRIPYPLTWIEWLHHDRPHWMPENKWGSRPIDPERHQREPHRIGILMQQYQDGAHCWKTHLFWSMIDKPVHGSRFNTSIQAVAINSMAEPKIDILAEAVRPTKADYGRELIVGLMKRDPWAAQRLVEYAVEDWGGEIRYMIAILGLLNTRNVAEVKPVDHTETNKKRARHNKRPLFSHKILKVRPSIIVARSSEGSGEHRDLRLHFVMGHFKHRKSGVYWWNTHARGKLKHGAVFKDYQVEGETHGTS